MNPILTLKKISKTFKSAFPQKLLALENINLEINQGEFFIIAGPSGSGKSTLLRIMSGLEKEYKGEVNFSSEISSQDLSFVFQQFALMPWLTVFQNVGIGLTARKTSNEILQEKVKKELKLFGLEKFASSFPKELSGGMKQRVGLARALATDPKIIFMDEPFSELDSFTAESLRDELLSVWQERKMTIIMVTHLVEEALKLADRIAVLTPSPGKIESIIINSLSRPRDKRSHDFYKLEDKLYQLIKP